MNLIQRIARTALTMVLSVAVAVVVVSCGTANPSQELVKSQSLPAPTGLASPASDNATSPPISWGQPPTASSSAVLGRAFQYAQPNSPGAAMAGAAPTETMYIGREAKAGKAMRRRTGSHAAYEMEGAAADAEIGGGTLACIPDGASGPDEYVPVPLEHTDVQAAIDGFITRVGVKQTFSNPYSEKIEAVYVFPLPQDSAVSDFIMKIGDRTIRGIIREREEAKRLYEEARAQGHVASLLQQERPNIFTQKVANIEPGETIDIDITYFGTLPYRGGGFEFVFPMVVGPRYNPPGTTDPVYALPRGGEVYHTMGTDSAGSGSGGTNVTYLNENERSGHDIDISLDLDAGVSIEHLGSPTHAVSIDRTSPTTAKISLSPLDTIPNRDFVLRWEVAGDSIKTAMLTHEDERGGFFTLMLVPPAELESIDRAPMEMIFVLDCSGSMRGQPLDLARQAVKRALRSMRPDDTFQIIRFAQNAAQFERQPVKATPGNIARGIRYLDALQAGGGTNMIHGIKSALNFDHEDGHVRSIVFLTDGYIGNEGEILGAIGRNLGDARIFSFGIGSSPNRYLMQRMADIGNGVASMIGLDASRVDAMDEFFEMTSHPALRDVAIDLGGGVTDVFPSNMPDVFVGRPVFISGRLGDGFDGDVEITGRVGDREQSIDVQWSGHGDRPALPQIWARSLIKDLNDRMTWSTEAGLADRIRDTALAYNLASAFTSFVAVDSSRVTEGDHGTTVHVPVPVPEGVRYDTTVGRGG